MKSDTGDDDEYTAPYAAAKEKFCSLKGQVDLMIAQITIARGSNGDTTSDRRVQALSSKLNELVKKFSKAKNEVNAIFFADEE